MESPKLVQWCPSESDGPDFFECELGGKESSFESVELTEEELYSLFKLLQQRYLLLEALRRQHPNCNIDEIRAPSDKETELCASAANCHLKEMTKFDSQNDNEKTSGETSNGTARSGSQNSSSTSSLRCSLTSWGKNLLNREYHYADFEDLLESLAQSNNELLNKITHFEDHQNKYSDAWFEGIDDLKKQVGELLVENIRLTQELKLSNSLNSQLDIFIKANYTETEISQIMAKENGENLPNGFQDGKENTNTTTESKSDVLESDDNDNCRTEAEKKSEGNGLAKGVPKEEYEAMEKELCEVKEELKSVTEEKVKLREDLNYLTDHFSKQDSIQRMHIEKIEQENKQYYDIILEYQSGEHGRTREYDSILIQVERERNEKMASINEQKALRQQLENLSKTMKSMQIKNEELLRFQCNQDDQADDFKRLKQLFQENGLLSIEQIISLQRQNEAYREELINERKEKERLLSIKEKLRRDLDSMQSRISSLQEQVYKYREHIFYIQQRINKDGSTSPIPPSPLLETAPPSPLTPAPSPSFHNPSRLYGNNAPQYINENLLQGNVPPRFPLYAVAETGKKSGPTQPKHGLEGQGPGKPQWQYQQPKLGRNLSLDSNEWKRSGNSPQSWSSPNDSMFNSSSTGRHNSTNSYSSRSGSSLSTSSEEGLDGMDKPSFGRKHMGRNSDDFKQLPNFSGNPYEGWPRQNSNHMNPNYQRNPRRYSSPMGNGTRSPPDYWSQQMPSSKPWQSPLEQPQYQDTAGSGMRVCADPWQQPAMAGNIPKNSQVSMSTSGHGETGTYVKSGGFGNR